MFSLENVILYLVGFVIVTVGGYAIRFLKKEGILTKLQQQDMLVKIAVTSVQQGYSSLRGEQKLNIAKKQIVEMANHHGIKINEEQLNHVINAAVKELKKDFGEAWNK
ncbi:hypothetical protein CON15_19105 [Bacillus cereus]|uniref:Phage holin n=1 Tax=Bacillus thuringiensis TaxID=1428 RepID=A0AB36VGL1_BACTU|nr:MULTISPECIES: phage holin, LLH family [Bacillus cereus group]MDO6628720.1 phage holin, LLH family [Bacillus thuringiensis]MDO6659155.1 phage holin, LLH family [Bacillus thuringiensis]MDO6698941.1 phage holin, LLH family [Bacillus thuringiensis]MEB9469420.1 phage holin, LLH family [Bacillus cereus]MRA82369.1 hypothetical protein [Bacillus thuringiensis]